MKHRLTSLINDLDQARAMYKNWKVPILLCLKETQGNILGRESNPEIQSFLTVGTPYLRVTGEDEVEICVKEAPNPARGPENGGE